MGEPEIENDPGDHFPGERPDKEVWAGLSKNDWNAAGMPRKGFKQGKEITE